MTKCEPDEHTLCFYPSWIPDKKTTGWRGFFGRYEYGRYAWFCTVCGTEMEPVFKEKDQK